MVSDNIRGAGIALGSIFAFILFITLMSRLLSRYEGYKRNQYFDGAFMTDTYPYISRI